MKASGLLDVGCDLKNPNFAAMAEAMGVKGVRVEKPQDLEGALTAALRHDGPALVDVLTARQELVLPPKTTLGQAYAFNLFLLKAVMNGRADRSGAGHRTRRGAARSNILQMQDGGGLGSHTAAKRGVFDQRLAVGRNHPLQLGGPAAGLQFV